MHSLPRQVEPLVRRPRSPLGFESPRKPEAAL